MDIIMQDFLSGGSCIVIAAKRCSGNCVRFNAILSFNFHFVLSSLLVSSHLTKSPLNENHTTNERTNATRISQFVVKSFSSTRIGSLIATPRVMQYSIRFSSSTIVKS